MIKQIFYLKSDKINTFGECPIFLKLSYKGNSTTLSTGKWIMKERWKATNKLKNSLRIDKERNCKIAIDRIAEGIEMAYYELLKTNKAIISVVDIKNMFTGKTDKINEVNILEVFEFHNKHFEKKVNCGEKSKASLQKYKRATNLLSEYLLIKLRKKSFPINEINNQFVFNLESYLKYESSFGDKIGIGRNSVIKYFQCFKTMCKYTMKMGLTKHNPFLCYDEKLVIKDAIYLTQDELEKIEKKEFYIKRLDKVRDIFLFSCYTSYAPIDAMSLTINNLAKDNEGDLWINTNRMKTNVKSEVPVLPSAERIIEKYASVNGDKLLPKMSNQKMNAYLKEIADLCGIQKKLCHYVARHTFATTVTLGNGVDIENVSKMMGHTRIATTQHYAKVMAINVKKDMDKLRSKYS